VTDSKLNVGDLIEVTTERLAYGGEAVARHDGLAVFIPLAAPREKLRVRITERKKNFARAIVENVLEPSQSRREPPCRYFGECGGCQLQHLSYEAQLKSKVGFVRDALERVARIDWPHDIKMINGAEFGYRSRTQVKIDWRARSIGFSRARSNTVCDIETCPILVPVLDKALRSLRGVVSTALEQKNGGLLYPTQIEMGAGDSTVSFEPNLKGLPSGALRQTVHETTYSFSPSTFFQGNAGLLAALIDEAIGRESGEVALDLYAGVGLFAIQLASRFNRVIAVEADRATASFAVGNIAANRLTNIEFHNRTVESWLKNYIETNPSPPDFLLLDPPRRGASEAMTHTAALEPARITYVSCDPTTLARDLRTLVDSGYEIARLTAIDLFPQTYHIETVVALVRR